MKVTILDKLHRPRPQQVLTLIQRRRLGAKALEYMYRCKNAMRRLVEIGNTRILQDAEEALRKTNPQVSGQSTRCGTNATNFRCRCALIGAAAAAIVLMFASLAQADDIQEPTDPLAKAAFEVLNKHCARCHQVGRLIDREKPAHEFGNILKFNEITTNVKLIVPGDGHASYIVQQIVNEKMPQDYWELGTTKEHPSKEHIDALIAWIDGLGKTVVASCRPPISNRDIVSLIAKDLDSTAIPQLRKSGTRYLMLANIYNSCVDDKTLDSYRRGAIKLVNSLARLSNIIRIEPIDPAKTILRINIDDLGWSAADWETVLAVYPYATRPPDTVLNVAIESLTKTKLAYVRADWFAFTASRPPLYNKLLGLPPTFQ
jgi:hypothetical protein